MFTVSVVFFVLGLALGSFISALTWRIHQQTKKSRRGKKKAIQELSILKGRSMCPNCRHKLAWYDLIPIFSWLSLGGVCRYCRQPISWQYPALELACALWFGGSYLFWPGNVDSAADWWLLTTWLVSSVGLIALAFYDLRWMLLPNRIIYPTLTVAVVGRTGYIAFFEDRRLHSLVLLVGSILIASGIFWLLFHISKGKWIGYGDVRLGLITGTLLAQPEKSFAMIFLASLLGCLAILPALAKGNKSLASKLPFGPFLILATGIIFIFGSSLIEWYKNLFGTSL